MWNGRVFFLTFFICREGPSDSEIIYNKRVYSEGFLLGFGGAVSFQIAQCCSLVCGGPIEEKTFVITG